MHQGLEVGEGKYSRVFLSTPWWVCFLFWYFLFFVAFLEFLLLVGWFLHQVLTWMLGEISC